MSTGEIGSLGTGPMSYTREEVAALVAPLVLNDPNPDPGEIGCFIILTAGIDGQLSGWRTDCKAPEHAIGLLSQGITAAARLILIERSHNSLHEHHPRPHQQGDAGTLGDGTPPQDDPDTSG